jgi:methanogenic corrinoid protein MtbC1
MDKLTAQIKQLNIIYRNMTENYSILKKTYRNHSSIKQKFVLSEEIFLQGLMLIHDKIEAAETKREFTRIIKGAKNG